MRQQNTPLAWILLITLSLIWGSSFILIKKGLIALAPEEVGALRIVAAFVVLIPFAIRGLRQVKKEQWRFLISVGLSGSLIPSFLFATAQTEIPSAITGVLNTLTPICTILFGVIVYHQVHPRRVFFGAFIGIIGTAILILARSAEELTINIYALLVVLATLFYATNLNLIKYHLQGLRSPVFPSFLWVQLRLSICLGLLIL